MDILDFIQKMPKVELHCHLDGSVRPSTMLEILQKQYNELQGEKLSDFENKVKVKDRCESLNEYLEKFKYPIKVMQKKENIYRITLELLEDCKRQGVKYIEIRFAPYLHLEEGLSIKEVIDTVLQAMKQGEKEFSVISNLIVCAMRHESVEKNIDLVEQVKEYKGKGVVAIDLAGNEADFPPELHKSVFDLAKKYGFHITIHAGETGIEQNIIKSVELLHAERIGHGVSAYKDPKVVQYLIDKNIPLEMCITSNYNTMAVRSKKDHPIKKYLQEGVSITLNTDNETVSDVDLNKEFLFMSQDMETAKEQMSKITLNSINRSFASEEQKTRFMEVFNGYF